MRPIPTSLTRSSPPESWPHMRRLDWCPKSRPTSRRAHRAGPGAIPAGNRSGLPARAGEPQRLRVLYRAHTGSRNKHRLLGTGQPAGTPSACPDHEHGPGHQYGLPINFSYDALGPEEPQITIVDPLTKIAIPIPMPGGLRPPLARSPAKPLRKTLRRDTANLNPAQAALRELAAQTGSSDAVNGSGEIDALRYGRGAASRRLVGVRGAGQSYDGNYYVQKVTHRIKRGRIQAELHTGA